MAIDLSLPIVDSVRKLRLEKKAGVWTLFTREDKPHDQIVPQDSLVKAIRVRRHRMSFHDFSGVLDDWGVTIQDCFRENRVATLMALEDSMGYMMGPVATYEVKYRQYRDSIERIRQCDDLAPELAKILDNYLKIWDALPFPAG